MDNIYLKYPEVKDEKEWLNYVLEYRDKDILSPLSYTLNTNFSDWVKKQEMHRNGITHKDFPIPTSVFFLMQDERIIGTLVIRHNIDNDYLYNYSGHVKIGIRPSERNKGYGTMLLNMAFEKCYEIGLDEVYLISPVDNTISINMIRNAGGILHEMTYDEYEQQNYKKFYVNVKEKINSKRR